MSTTSFVRLSYFLSLNQLILFCILYTKKAKKLKKNKHLLKYLPISLQSLSKKLSISSHMLSQIINEKMNKNFWDFINTYRIEEAKKLLRDPKRANQKILSIAFDVGFNTKTAFNNTFKKYTKMTPSQYKKKVNINSILFGTGKYFNYVLRKDL